MPVRGYTPSYNSQSPYRLTPVGGNFMSYYIHRSIDPQDDDIVSTMDNPAYVGRPDLLAFDIYGDAQLWWVFGVRNGWEDPVHDLKLNTRLFIPSQNYIGSIL